jgi:hypothetical protein
MASKKPSAVVAPQEKVVSLVKKPETFVGALALTSLGVIGVSALQNTDTSIRSMVLPTQTPPAITEVARTATSSSVPATASAQPTPIATPSATPAPLAVIEKLANTSAGKTVVAQVNDTFWSIARKNCGQGIQGYRIQEENGYQLRHLHPGDTITVVCLEQ